MRAARPVPAAAVASGIEVRTVRFAKGESSATTKGSIKGDRTIDYKLRARAGQTMSVSLKTTNGANYFNVLPPGSSDVAVFVGSTGGNEWKGKLEADGEYTIRVYLMRSAARRNETANYTLSVGINGASSGATAPAAAPRVRVPRSAPAWASSTRRATSPARRRRGSRWVSARSASRAAEPARPRWWSPAPTAANGSIFFDKGKATGADLSQADGNMAFRATQGGGPVQIQAGNERYEIPEAAIFGG